MKVLVTAGAGYIGNVVAAQLLAVGHDVVVVDDLSAWHRVALPDGAEFVAGDVTSVAGPTLSAGIDAVVHLVAASQVATDPGSYRRQNLDSTVAPLEANTHVASSVHRLLLHPAVYGEPERVLIEQTAYR
jgi:UDP-glucose 4-epimerase